PLDDGTLGLRARRSMDKAPPPWEASNRGFYKELPQVAGGYVDTWSKTPEQQKSRWDSAAFLSGWRDQRAEPRRKRD
ncbi:hypothetical protein, partial [Caldimonas sp.]|uniref:hypothetical protein n=1 Tax=Caldimonas sp. TaxID=2838790 RepID=UPI00391DC651